MATELKIVGSENMIDLSPVIIYPHIITGVHTVWREKLINPYHRAMCLQSAMQVRDNGLRIDYKLGAQL